MAGSVHPGVMPIKHMLSMAGQTDVGMEKEELGLMTFTGFQVLKLFSHDVIDYAGGRKLRQLLITSSGSRGNRFTSHAVFFSQEGVSSALLPATAVYSRSGMAGAYTGHVQLVEVD